MGLMRKGAGLAILAAIGLGALLPALGEAGKPSAWPKSSGILEHAPGARSCDTAPGVGKLDVTVRECEFGFYVPPDESGDPDHWYVVDWVVYRVEPTSGCLVSAHGSQQTDTATIAASTPRSTASGRTRLFVSVDSETGPRYGKVWKNYRLGGQLTTEVRPNPKGDRFTWKWRGPTRRPITIGFGVAQVIPVTEDEFSFTSSGQNWKVTRGC